MIFTLFGKYPFLSKLLFIGLLSLILLIPAAMITDLVRERQERQDAVVREVGAIWGGSQVIQGPVLSIPYTQIHENSDGTLVSSGHLLHILPDSLHFDGEIDPEMRNRGIYEAVEYTSGLRMTGAFPQIKEELFPPSTDKVFYNKAYLQLGISDLRGIQESVKLKISDLELTFDAGVLNTEIFNAGIHTYLDVSNDQLRSKGFQFSSVLELNGSESIQFVPMGKQTDVTLHSAWADPGFSGAFLPDQREVSDAGFSAHWKVLHLNRNFPQSWSGRKYQVAESVFGVNILLPVDRYQKTERSTKYAIMFIGLMFLAFFLLETLYEKPIKSFQYILIGLALVIFYSLLLSLSEHVSFDLAYLISSSLVIIMVAMYVLSIMKSIKMSTISLGLLAAMYSFCYVLLQMQEMSLLIGTLGIFSILGLVMYLTNKIKWTKEEVQPAYQEPPFA